MIQGPENFISSNPTFTRTMEGHNLPEVRNDGKLIRVRLPEVGAIKVFILLFFVGGEVEFTSPTFQPKSITIMETRKITITVPATLFNAINKATSESLEGRQAKIRRYIVAGLEEDGKETSVEKVHLLRKDGK